MMCCPGVSGGCSHCHTLRQQHYGVQMWLDGDPGMPPPPMARKSGRNKNWHHLVRDPLGLVRRVLVVWQLATLTLCTPHRAWLCSTMRT